MSKIIAVVSGKGGVGKSTVAVNLALSIAKIGHKVALIDCDFYGPSIPTLLGSGTITVDHEEKLIPAEKHGIKYISIGFFLPNPDEAVIWRGPMFHTAMKQMFSDVNWGVVDYFVVDMPPGTGDAQISLTQNYPLAGAVVVTTPQEVALSDVRKSINMLIKVNVPVIGIVENMAGFITPDGKRHDIFGSGGGAAIAKKFGLPLLASLPLDPTVREGGDLGKPVACEDNHPIAKIFLDLANSVLGIVEEISAKKPQLTVVN
ncbi:MAG: Mrp/NBP35 family ATP-binding protein [bacterium]|nr:Mrp/NBP35 family ATP-binding protein [bacterium]